MRQKIELSEEQEPLDVLIPLQEPPRESFYYENGMQTIADVLPNTELCSDIMRFFDHNALQSDKFIADEAEERQQDLVLLLEELGIIRADWKRMGGFDHKPVGYRPLPIAYDTNIVRDTIDLIKAVHKDLEHLESFRAEKEYFEQEQWRQHVHDPSFSNIAYDNDSMSLRLNKTSISLRNAPTQADLCRVIFKNWPGKKSWERDEILKEWGWPDDHIYTNDHLKIRKKARLPVYTAGISLNRKIAKAAGGRIMGFFAVTTQRIGINQKYKHMLANT